MKIEVWTGQTKAPSNTVLLPIILGSEKSDRVFLLLQSEGKGHGIDNLREECVSVLTHAVIEGEGTGYEKLESALKELNGLLKGFLLSDAVHDVHAVIGLLEPDGSMHLSHVGRAEAYVVRDGTAIQVTEYYRGKPPSAFMHIVSGPVQPKDHFIISTQRLLRSMTPAQLTQTVHQHNANAVENIISRLSSEKETACIIHIAIPGDIDTEEAISKPSKKESSRIASKPRTREATKTFVDRFKSAASGIRFPSLFQGSKARASAGSFQSMMETAKDQLSRFIRDLHHPERKRRAHLLLLAGTAALFLVIWVVTQLSVSGLRSQTKGELQELVKQINTDISTAESRQLAGDTDSANMILARAETRAKTVISNESGLFRDEALKLLDTIKTKSEEMHNIVRIVNPRVMASISGKKSDVMAQGFVGYPNGEFTVYDRQDLYRISLNIVESGERLGSQELILDATSFPRFQSTVFLTTGNSILELEGGQSAIMKTEDTAGWVTGADIKTYLRYLYILSPERKQIYKYERLSGKYGPPSEYNVNGDLTGALDMTIVGPVYVLKDLSASGGKTGDREIVKLLRGEKQTFNMRSLPPDGLKNVTKIFKSSPTGKIYLMDPEGKRIIVATNDGDLGDSLYLKQYILDSEQVGKLKDIFVDPDDLHLYVLDEKKLYSIDLQEK